MRISAALFGLGFCALQIAPLAAQGRAFTPKDWYRVTTVSTPAVSPDGRQVAFTVTTVREADNRRHQEIWLASLDGGEPSRLTSPGTESSNPRWSPDGKLLLFTSQRPGGRGRTWGLRMDRPGGEAFEVDSIPNGSTPADGRFVVWAEADTAVRDTTLKDPFEKMQPMARPPFGAITRPLDPARFDGRHVVELPYKANGQGFLPNPREKPAFRSAQLWMRALDGSAKRRITDTRYSHRNVAVSPDGQWIAFTADPALRADSAVRAERDSIGRRPYDARRDEAVRNDSDLFVVAVGGGMARRITRANGDEGNLAWSPDSRRIAFVSRTERTENARLYVVDAAGGDPVNLLGEWASEPADYWWLQSGEIAMSAEIGGRSGLFLLAPSAPADAKAPALREVLGGRRRMSGWSLDPAGRTVAYVATSSTRPSEIYVAQPDGTNERQLTRFNDKLNQEVAWADAERFTYRSVGGMEIEAWLMKPHGYESGRRYPLVLYIHGGPHSAYGENWFDEFQNLAGAGLYVLYTNPRGSSGYGAPFTFSTRGRWFAEDYQDLMRGVDLVSRRPDVDSSRMGVTGGSYGGVMAAWVTAKTNRFKAAQTDRMISNWWSWYGSSDAQGLTEFEFYGKPWDNPAMYDSLSPLRQIRKVRTPTLIVQSEEDHRTPMTDAEQWFMGLKKQGTAVELVRYPRSTHDLSRTGEPWLLVDRLGRLRQWFDHWLKPSTGATVAGGSR